MDLTVNCLRHLQSVSESNTSVILIDNASDGNVSKLAEDFQTNLKIETICNKTNLGFGKAVNQGIQRSDPSSDIVLLNNDVLIDDVFWLQKLQVAAYSNEKIGAVGCRLTRDDGILLHAGIHLPPESFWAQDLGGGETDLGQYQISGEVFAVTFALVYLKRALVEKIGLLDEAYFAYFEDVDYCLRAKQAGFHIYYLGDLTCTHLQGSSTAGNKKLFNSLYRNSQAVFMNKWSTHKAFQYECGIVWHSLANFPTGYCTFSQSSLKEFERNRIDVRYKYIYGKDTVFPVMERLSPDPIGLAIQSRPLVNFPVQITHSQGDLFYKNFGKYKIGFTMLEADGLPQEWVRQCNQMDEIWVPSTFNYLTFSEAGVKRPIHVMPHGIDIQHFNRHIRPQRFSERFTFFSNFEWSERKGQEILIKAFLEEFADDDALLILKFFNPDVRNDISLELSWLGVRLDDRQKLIRVESQIPYNKLGTYDREKLVLLSNAEVPYYQIGSIYRGTDCFVLPTKGEGWGRPIMEAMACGVPVIATDWSGQCDFLNANNGYPIRVQRKIPCITRSPYYKGLQWAEPDCEHLKHLMRHVFENREEAKQKAERASEFIIQNYNNAKVARLMVNRIKEIYADSAVS